MAEVSCLPPKVMLLQPLRSLHPSATRKTAVSVFLSAPTYTGLLSIFAKFKALGALGCRERVAKIIMMLAEM